MYRSITELFPNLASPPIICAPMASVTGPALCEAMHSANALPFLAGGYSLPSSIPAFTGIGFLVWHTPLADAVSLVTNFSPPAVWLHAPANRAQLVEWIDAMQNVTPRPVLFYQCASVADAKWAVEFGVEVIVAQGADSGGHGNRVGAGMVVLVSELADAVGSKAVVLAAGGIMDGRGVAAALCAGAAGVVLGTRLIPTKESSAPNEHKAMCLGARDGGASTVRTRVYDELRGRGDWPAQYDGRAIANETHFDAEKGIEREVLEKQYENAVADNDWKRLTAFAGTGVGLIDNRFEEPAAQVVERIRKEAREVLMYTNRFVNEIHVA